MILYAESSAVLAWLLGETRGPAVRDLLSAAQVVFASRLTVAEAERGLVRVASAPTPPLADVAALRQTLARAGAHWVRVEVAEPVLRRVGQPFPAEPVRTLDAIHLATALELAAREPGLALLSLDSRIRENAGRLGLPVVP